MEEVATRAKQTRLPSISEEASESPGPTSTAAKISQDMPATETSHPNTVDPDSTLYLVQTQEPSNVRTMDLGFKDGTRRPNT